VCVEWRRPPPLTLSASSLTLLTPQSSLSPITTTADYCPTFTKGYDKDSVLVMAALAAKWHEPARDALDTMVLGAVNIPECDKYKQIEFLPFDPGNACNHLSKRL
jgi:hypothetical protein